MALRLVKKRQIYDSIFSELRDVQFSVGDNFGAVLKEVPYATTGQNISRAVGDLSGPFLHSPNGIENPSTFAVGGRFPRDAIVERKNKATIASKRQVR